MATFIVIIIVAIVIYKSLHKDESPKAAEKWRSHFAEGYSEPPRYVTDRNTNKTENERSWDQYWTDHFFSLDLNCFVKRRRSGTFVKSIPFEDWEDGEQDDTREIVFPTDILDERAWEIWDRCESLEGFYDEMDKWYPEYDWHVSDDDDEDEE